MPSTSAPDLYARMKRWFVHYHQDDWGAEDRPPDLHLYFPRGMDHTLMLVSDDWAPPAGVPAGRFGVWQEGRHRAFAGAPAAGENPIPKDHSDRVLPPLAIDSQRRSYRGVWFRLTREPQPQRYLGKMLHEIDGATGQPEGWALRLLIGLYGRRVEDMTAPAILALGYPGPGGQEVWLFLRAKLVGPPGARGKWTKAEYLDSAPVESYETAPADQVALMRRTGHIAGLLTGRRVAIFGQGALGSSIALLLAKTGVQRLLLVDYDLLRPGNVVRHSAGLGAVGLPKTAASRLTILEHAPDCQVEEAPATWEPDELARRVQGVDVVVDATANLAFSLLLNEICLGVGRPAIYAATYRRGAIGRVRIIRPGLDACLVCHEVGYADAADYPEIPRAAEGEFVEVGCGIPTVEASAIDIETTANWTARAALWLLQDKLTGNLCLVVNDVLPELAPRWQQVGVHWSAWPPLGSCLVCARSREAA
jgi:molybdopterin/thiamine biosynthesis adenylyltransferase